MMNPSHIIIVLNPSVQQDVEWMCLGECCPENTVVDLVPRYGVAAGGQISPPFSNFHALIDDVQ